MYVGLINSYGLFGYLHFQRSPLLTNVDRDSCVIERSVASDRDDHL